MMKTSLNWATCFFCLCLAVPAWAQNSSHSLSLNDVLNLATQKSESVNSLNKSIESLESEIRARDALLDPILTSDLSVYKDRRENNSGLPAREGLSKQLGVSLIKPFSTGTTFTLSAGHQLLGKDDNYPEQDTAAWEIRLSQSLWRDSFGNATDFRRSAEKFELLSRRQSFEYEKRQFLINVESAYWDLVLAEKEQVLRAGNIDRSTSLESWTRKRLNRFAAESSDLLQVQSLLAQRKLDLMVVKNNLETARNTLRQYIPSLDFTNQKINIRELETDRALTVTSQNKIPIRLDALSALNKSQQAYYEAEKAVDSTRPLLDLYASYGANGIDQQFDPAWDRAKSGDHTQEKIGIVFAMSLDGSSKTDQRTAAKSNAEALKVRAEGLKRASDIAWTELLRNISQLKEQIKIAQEVNQLQSKKLIAERRRYQQGRTTTLQMTTFEVEATLSELTLNRLLVELKKAESLIRLYTFEGAPS